MCACSFLSADTFSFCENNLLLSFRSRERPSHTTDADFLFSFFGIGTHGQQAIPPSFLFLMTNNVDVLFFQSYFSLLPLHTQFCFFFFLFFSFFFFPVTLCFLCTSGPYGISSSLTTAWERKTSHTNCFTLVTTGNLYANFFFCLGAEKKGQLYIFFKLTQTHMSKIKFTFYSCSEYWLLTLSKETCRDQALWLIWLPF